ncbi:hypothetical protein LTR96_011273 [Exophiala xenobiotica]|nr:hypothetical protein LTR72_011612 [Exophiala xenobiotica]KAK5263314.1 hypothetical protein LTR96_011273 [Exophiala xenobiotica]KAK5284856.1 hypothetical protein LTR14_011444 [Exophiala xenobiotica]KAK5332648.1 hypothetical protein LTR98_011234 [Exophiala xenobiotica]KAK5469008.1 hypothetical protein LTR55_011464 [Exophiala xenobiotica]
MFNARSSLAAADLGSLPSPVVHRHAPVAPFEDARSTSENGPLLDSAMIMPGNRSISLEDIGLPSDGLWDYDAAYERRYCYEHGEFEYLLTTPDRWISSDDLGTSDAEARLKKLLQKHRTDPAIFDPVLQQYLLPDT